MALSPELIRWLGERLTEARAILANPKSTQSQRTVARHTLSQWGRM